MSNTTAAVEAIANVRDNAVSPASSALNSYRGHRLMAEAWQQPHLTSHEPAEVGTDFELTPYDELAASRNGKQRCRFVDEYMMK